MVKKLWWRNVIDQCVGIVLISFLTLLSPAHALDPVRVSESETAIDITRAIESYHETDGLLQVSTAPDAEGIVRRVEVRSRTKNALTNWAVFSLANSTDKQIDRLIVSPHYRLVDSGFFWPDLDKSHILAITPSEGFSLEQQKNSDYDVFLITLDPGAVITLIAELRSPELKKLYLWEPSTFKDTTNSYTLYYGIVLGISGLLALFLTILFLVKGASVFPATACLAWAVLIYICVDFGFWNKFFDTHIYTKDLWRAAAETFLSINLIIFLYAYLSLNRWHNRFSIITMTWLLILCVFLALTLIEPQISSGIARVSILFTTGFGAIIVLYLAFKQFDRAIMLVPTWILMSCWTIAAFLTIIGNIENDIIQPALGGGLVLLILLLSFTVMQLAFAGGGFAQGLVSDSERSALALRGAGEVLWDWDINKDQISVGEGLSKLLKLNPKDLNTKPENWKKFIHPNDRDRFESSLNVVIEHKRGKVTQVIRLKDIDGNYYWFNLRARPLLDTSGQVSRCIGTLNDVTDQKRAENHILYDSVHDHLTKLENRIIFSHRLETLIALSNQDDSKLRPTVIYFDIDEFSKINEEYGHDYGDNILLALSRRLTRLLKPCDSMARLSGDKFAILLVSETEPKAIATFANTVLNTIKAPVEFSEQNINLHVAIGLVSWTPEHTNADQMIRDAELAKNYAKRMGNDTIETFVPALRTTRDESIILQEDLKFALERDEIILFYQPIVDLETRQIHGFEALMRWQHPKLGLLLPGDFVPIAESSGFINQLSVFVMKRAAEDFVTITNTYRYKAFVSVNISSRELLRSDLVPDISNILDTTGLPADQLRIELTESMVMENPEYSAQILNRISELGIGISLDDFGTQYSSLSYLMKFPFDTMKIDKAFIQSRYQEERLVILQSIVNLAQGLNQSIIVEGAEYETDLADLLQLGCDYGQGYLFGKPMSIEDVHNVIAAEVRKLQS